MARGRKACLMAAVRWGQELAEVYDAVYAAESEPSALDPVVDLLAGLANGGFPLEFGVGAGRGAPRLRRRRGRGRGNGGAEPKGGRAPPEAGGRGGPPAGG